MDKAGDVSGTRGQLSTEPMGFARLFMVGRDANPVAPTDSCRTQAIVGIEQKQLIHTKGLALLLLLFKSIAV